MKRIQISQTRVRKNLQGSSFPLRLTLALKSYSNDFKKWSSLNTRMMQKNLLQSTAKVWQSCLRVRGSQVKGWAWLWIGPDSWLSQSRQDHWVRERPRNLWRVIKKAVWGQTRLKKKRGREPRGGAIDVSRCKRPTCWTNPWSTLMI